MKLSLPALPTRLLAPLLAGLLAHTAQAADPAWWTARGVVNTGLPVEDYGKLNLGQLKHMAAEARNELNVLLSAQGGAGAAVDTLVTGWATTTNADDYAVCNLGQLKAVGKVFWDRMIATNRATGYPWTGSANPVEDYAAANLGQLKTVFNISSDNDADGLNDTWELSLAASLSVLGGTVNGQGRDYDADGVSDLQEYLANTSPVDPAPVLTVNTPVGATLF